MNLKESVKIPAVLERNLVLLVILLILLIGIVLRPLKEVMMPIIIAIFLSFLLKPLVIFLKRKKAPAFLAVLITLLILFIILNLLGMLVYSSVLSFIREFPHYERKFEDLYFTLIKQFHITHSDVKQFYFTDQWTGGSVNLLISYVFGSVFNFFSTFFLILIILAFLLFGEGNLTRKAAMVFRGRVNYEKMLKRINFQVFSYLLTKTVISFLTGLAAGLILAIYGVDFPIMWGFLTFLLNFIPNLGSIVATVLPCLQSMIQFGDLSRPLWILFTLSFLQMVMGNILDPMFTGQNMNMSPVTVLISLIFWGWMWGIQGMFIAVPLTSIIMIVCENIPSLRFVAILMSNKEDELLFED